jgi:hypothetical protein
MARAEVDCAGMLDRRAPIAISASLNSIGDNPILPLPKRAFNQTLRGIGRLPEQSFQDIKRAIDIEAWRGVHLVWPGWRGALFQAR